MLILKPEVCANTIIDLGCGYGRSTLEILNACENVYLIGIDVECNKLINNVVGKTEYHVDFICCNSIALPIRDSAVNSITSILTIHELPTDSITSVLNEVNRVLIKGGYFLVIDKVKVKVENPSRELPLLTELAYHKAREYALGIKSLGVLTPKELIRLVVNAGFKLIKQGVLKRGKWLSGAGFLKCWGKETLKLINMISDEEKKAELMRLVNRIKEAALRYGHGPVNIIVALFKKP